MKIFNSLTGKKETFRSKINEEVSIYICGLTPYDDVHIGHARTFVNFDVIVKSGRFASSDASPQDNKNMVIKIK